MQFGKKEYTKLEVMQDLAKRNGYKSYLEIGVQYGNTFFPLEIENKTGIEPETNYILAQNYNTYRAYRELKNIGNNIYGLYSSTSDEYFKSIIHETPSPDGAEKTAALVTETFDFIHVDGLHTAEQCHRDIENSLKCLAPGGMIAVHDTNPTTRWMANPGGPIDPNAEWCGDVWKAILWLRCDRDDLEIYTYGIRYGLTVIKRAPGPTEKHPGPRDTDYPEFAEKRQEILNLREYEPAENTDNKPAVV